MTCPRVLLADDNPEVRYKVLQLLESDFDIVGSVDDGQQAIHSALRLNPDILVTDISMPLANGFQVASQLRHSGSTTKVIVLTVQDDHDYVEAAFSNGAFGYVLKPRIATDLIPAIQGALEGRRVASGTMRSKVSLVEGEPPPQLVTRGRNSLARCGSSRKSDRRLDKHSARRRTLHR